jgi:O-antigen/teichoic acid export membrane protein
VYSTALISLLFTTFLFLLVIGLFHQGIANWMLYPDNPEYILLFSGIVAMDAFTAVPFARLRAQNKAFRFSLIKLVNVSVIVVSVLFFLSWAPAREARGKTYLFDALFTAEVDVVYVLIANFIGSAVTLILLLKDSLRMRWVFDFQLWLQMLKYGFPLLIAGLAGSLNDALDKMILRRLLPDENTALQQLGIYAANYKIAVLMALFIQMFRFAIEPFFFEKASHKDARQSYAEVMKYYVIVSMLLFLAINLFISLVKGLIDPSYQEALNVVPIVSFGYLLYGIFVNLSVWYKINDLTRYGAYITIAGVLVTISINVLFIPVYGYNASAWAHVACYGLMVLLSYILGRRFYRLPYDISGILIYVFLGLSLYLVWSSISFPSLTIELLVSSVFMSIFLLVAIIRDKLHLMLKRN